MSTIKVNTITTRSGSTITLGESGKTITLACGASQSGFGRTGTVDWCTTAKTSPFTSVSGKGYFVNTTSGAVTVTLPSSPSAGDIIAIKDYANTFDTNSVTIGRNGSKINGECSDAELSTESQSVTLIYVDGTKGWQDIHDSTSDVTGQSFICASGGNTVATACTNYKVHTFTSDGTFTVNSGVGAKATVSYLVVAGGGAGGKDRSGGGGAGGFREGRANTPTNPDSYSVSPLDSATGITLTPGAYPVTVGGGGAAIPGPNPANSEAGTGSNSIFSTITSAGGGRGGSGPGPYSSGGNGGSGGGSDAYGYPSSPSNMAAGSGNTPPVSPPQGNNGGVGVYNNPNGTGQGGGGGGATAVGTSSTPGGHPGGAGATTSINATPTAYAGGGGGSSCSGGSPSCGQGGTGGGGNGANDCNAATAGTDNTGGGGGAGNGGNSPEGTLGKSGGSGIVIIRYKFQ